MRVVVEEERERDGLERERRDRYLAGEVAKWRRKHVGGRRRSAEASHRAGCKGRWKQVEKFFDAVRVLVRHEERRPVQGERFHFKLTYFELAYNKVGRNSFNCITYHVSVGCIFSHKQGYTYFNECLLKIEVIMKQGF
ncbi:hypothetical protein AMTR_s00095p00127220 [Amborella trichopoda]|uniref:Uncharacterized protein n=1 Tax=Amborella trichopoda TaxID=13333 RepID=W1NU71_AMBTC|nr:hypothetical protein AMTR_s00095p00127220 [Amborella trichopoda]